MNKQTSTIDPYEATGSHLRVHHPVQGKTQREKWETEIEENYKQIFLCGCEVDGEQDDLFAEHNCFKEGSDNCNKRKEKIRELMRNLELDHKVNGLYLNRHPTGMFADDIQPKKSLGARAKEFFYNLIVNNLP